MAHSSYTKLALRRTGATYGRPVRGPTRVGCKPNYKLLRSPISLQVCGMRDCGAAMQSPPCSEEPSLAGGLPHKPEESSPKRIGTVQDNSGKAVAKWLPTQARGKSSSNSSCVNMKVSSLSAPSKS